MADRAIRRGYVDGGGGQIHYRIAGGTDPEAVPLLMLHPTPKSGWIYEGLMQPLATGGRAVIAPDTPGYGASDPLAAPATIAAYADAMFTLIERLTREGRIPPGPVAVLGYHTGSVTACEMALARPESVRRLVLFSLPLYDADERAAKRQALSGSPDIPSDGSHLLRRWNIVTGLCDRRVDAAWRHRSVAENLRACDVAEGYRAVYRYDLHAALPRIVQPVMLANAGDDLFAQTRLARSLISDLHYREWPAMAHGMFDLDTRELAQAVGEFLG
jgi:pimeloyl-ACP methyl ester carboxylesterase